MYLQVEFILRDRDVEIAPSVQNSLAENNRPIVKGRR